MLQNLSYSDATFRKKTGSECKSYASNLEESVGVSWSRATNMSRTTTVTAWNVHCNKEERGTLVADESYSRKENHDFDTGKDIRLVTTGLW